MESFFQDLKQIFGSDFNCEPKHFTEQYPLFSIENQSFQICRKLTESEIQLIHKMMDLYQQLQKSQNNESLATWLKKAWQNEERCFLPPHLQHVQWNHFLFFYLKIDEPLTKEKWKECNYFLESYFPSSESKKIQLSSQEWLILLDRKKLWDLECSEPMERSLYLQIAEGFMETFTYETGLRGKMIVHPPILQAEELQNLRHAILETEQLTKIFQPNKSVQAIWNIALEQLLSSLDTTAIQQYLKKSGLEPFLQNEDFRKSLETFFQFNCNISETARQLYIHRNTLLYRIERLKEETGLDIRNFFDGMMVQIALMLYYQLSSQKCITKNVSK
ncbi:PucR family transcriptional regulator [Thermoflavimicrobium dichotomicum]|uniref:PucR C-terminal helix-turn-helix domain-containing protein n=1 Tax=Thermoflavimicrobium dichotomicum TaxID=46223 RepID=A0A1I3P0J2_9BACL|nr:PucR family transcriptional regulator [Thermoflavimicrobium dichotomicum]SFJ14969.1 PucR C-terminal helix-turn-helix domain-containing protein [Thermoflavimicrobium dichotomicum]